MNHSTTLDSVKKSVKFNVNNCDDCDVAFHDENRDTNRNKLKDDMDDMDDEEDDELIEFITAESVVETDIIPRGNRNPNKTAKSKKAKSNRPATTSNGMSKNEYLLRVAANNVAELNSTIVANTNEMNASNTLTKKILRLISMLTNKKTKKRKNINTYERTEENLESLYQCIEKIKAYKGKEKAVNKHTSKKLEKITLDIPKNSLLPQILNIDDKPHANGNATIITKPIKIPKAKNQLGVRTQPQPRSQPEQNYDVPKLRISFMENLRQMVRNCSDAD